MYLTAFHGFLRIGEITVRGRNDKSSILIDQVKFFSDKNNNTVADIKITDFKHNQKREPFSIIIGPQDNDLCGVTSLKQFLDIRGQGAGPLFCTENLSPIHRNTFNKQLREQLPIV